MAKTSFRHGHHPVPFAVLLLLVLATSCSVNHIVQAQLSTSFYDVTCPNAQDIVRTTLRANFIADPTIAGHVLRMQFHDCGVQGCDASLLLTGPNSEQLSAANAGLTGFAVIDALKAAVEASCAGVVSCADILVMASRDAVFLTGGPDYTVSLGRFDSSTSGGLNLPLPGPQDTAEQGFQIFQGMGLTIQDMVVLLGSHTIGRSHCGNAGGRVTNFNNTALPDPSINPSILASLQQVCNPTSPSPTAVLPLDVFSEFTFDTHFYENLINQNAILPIDNNLFTDSQTGPIVQALAANSTFFYESFAASMIKMEQFGVLNATTGTIRTVCSAAASN